MQNNNLTLQNNILMPDTVLQGDLE